MSDVTTLRIARSWGDITIRYDADQVLAELGRTANELLPPESPLGTEYDAWVVKSVTEVAFKSFRGKMDDQLRAAMARMIFEATGVGITAYVKFLSSAAKTREDKQAVRRLKKRLQRFRDGASHSISRMVHPVPLGRPGGFNDADVREAFNSLGANATREQVAEYLDISVERINQYRSKDFDNWEDFRRNYTQGGGGIN
jgi:hypothetical protein